MIRFKYFPHHSISKHLRRTLGPEYEKLCSTTWKTSDNNVTSFLSTVRYKLKGLLKERHLVLGLRNHFLLCSMKCLHGYMYLPLRLYNIILSSSHLYNVHVKQ